MLGGVYRGIYRLLALGAIRPPMQLLLKLSRQNAVPALMPVPAARRVLVLAPHMDDETIGCGGAILQHVQAGARIDVVFVTDGAMGFELGARQLSSHAERVELRRSEARAACDLLGVHERHFLDLPDGRSQADASAVSALFDIVAQARPDVVYLPFLTDSHHDHQTCNALMLALLAKDPSLGSLLCACYEVWTPLYPNSIVDISVQIDSKMAALACYKSQLAMNNYLNSVRGLNAYRAIANNSQGYAEAFYLTTLKEYAALAPPD